MATAEFTEEGKTATRGKITAEFVRPRKTGAPKAPTANGIEVRVLFELDELGMTYVEDKNRKRYFIDRDSDLAFKAVKGQVLMAQVNPAGYVYSASLVTR